MPEVTGTISDPARKRYYILRAAGSPAAEIFAFYARKSYEPKDIIHLDLLPVIMIVIIMITNYSHYDQY